MPLNSPLWDPPNPPYFSSTKFSLGCTSPDPFTFVSFKDKGRLDQIDYLKSYADSGSPLFVETFLANESGQLKSPNQHISFELPLVYGEDSEISLGVQKLTASDLTKVKLKEKANIFNYLIESQSEANPLRIVYSYWLYRNLGWARGLYQGLNAPFWPLTTLNPEDGQIPDWAPSMLDLDNISSNINLQKEFGGSLYEYIGRDISKWMNNDSAASITFNTTAVNELLSQQIYLDKTNFTPESVRIIIDPESKVQRGDPTLAHEQSRIVSSDTCSFQFKPGVMDQCSIQYSIEQGTTVTTTNGTESSSSNEQEASMDIDVGFEEDAEPFGIGVKTSLAVTSGYERSVENLKSINFSKQSSSTKNSTTTETEIIEPGTATKNSDGNYPFKEEVYYIASISQVQSNVNTPFMGDYKIGGDSAGVLIDSSSEKNKVSMTPALALYTAFALNYNQVSGNDISSIGSIDPEFLTIDFHGTGSGLTVLSTGLTVKYAEDSSQGDSGDSSQDNSTNTDGSSQGDSGTDQIPSARKFKKSSNVHTDLNEFDSTRLDRIGVHHVFPKKSLGSKSVSGTGHTDIVYASKKGRHTFKDFKNSFLHGNKNKDIYIFDKNSSGNSIEAFAGNDRIKSASTQDADLGAGDDTYKIMAKARPNSFHTFLSGDGYDKLVVASDKAEFRIGDFNPFMDKVIAGGSLKPELLTSKLVSN